MKKLKIKICILGMVRTNCYIIRGVDSKEAIVIDPADDAATIDQYLKDNALLCKGILLTHGHFDHILAATELADLNHVSIYAQEDEVEVLGDPHINCSADIRRECALIPDILLKDQEILTLAGLRIQVIHTPGHTKGGASYYFPDHAVLFSGDTLFREAVGRTDLPTGNSSKLLEAIRNKLMLLDDDVQVYPGHGAPTTIGYEQENNIYLTKEGALLL